MCCRVAKSSFSAEECAANAYQALKQAVERIPKKWAGVRAVFLKTPDSLALPVFQRLPASEPKDTEQSNEPVKPRQPKRTIQKVVREGLGGLEG